MLRSEFLPFTLKNRSVRFHLAVASLVAALLCAPSAAAQSFSLELGKFTPYAVIPGQSSNAIVTVSGSGETVDLGCQVDLQPTVPVCVVSPTSVSAPGSATLTVLTTYQGNTAVPGNYTIRVTGIASSGTQSLSGTLPVISVAPQYTITVTSPIAPSSVNPGNGGTATITVNPLYGYVGTVTLACSAVTPLVSFPPVCSFTYPNNPNGSGVVIPGAQPYAATLTISTIGPNTPAAVVHNRFFYAVWLPIPLALVGFGAVAGGRRSRRAWSLIALLVVGATFLLTPACGNNATTTPTGTGTGTNITPANSYTFTLTGVDALGIASSNSSTPPTVMLTVQ